MSTTNVETDEGRQRAGSAAAVAARLGDIVRKHAACYEVWPEWSLDGGRRVKVGFELQLCGTNARCAAHETFHHVPGCHSCRQTYEDLKEVAEWMLPNERRASRYEIQTFDRALHIAPRGRGARSEVVLTVKILHRHGFNDPVDACEELCLREMRRKLADLGMKEGSLPKAEARTGVTAGV